MNWRHGASRRRMLLAASALAGLGMPIPAALAGGPTLPTGGHFVAGAGTIAQSGAALGVSQSTARGVINWNSFSIGAGGTVSINNGTGATLNRVTGGDLSRIAGQLTATGSVYLVNPNGVVVNGSGQIITGGNFVATTQGIGTAGFMQGGAQTLSGSSTAPIVNAGTITSTGGNVVLVANSIRNAGTLAAPNGEVDAVAAHQVLLSDGSGGGHVLVQIPGGDITNTGVIAAVGVQLNAAGGDIYALSGNHGGVIQATGITSRGGHVMLSAGGDITNQGSIGAVSANGAGGAVTIKAAGTISNGGQISASGTQGGRVKLRAASVVNAGTIAADGKSGIGGAVTIHTASAYTDASLALVSAKGGGTISLVSQAGGSIAISGRLDATGNAASPVGGAITVTGGTVGLVGATLDASGFGAGAGGQILLGGNAAGAGTLAQASVVNIDAASLVRADGGTLGHGGTVALWSTSATNDFGSISVRGGALGGDGGSIEISSAGTLQFMGPVDMAAPMGLPGSLLIDPSSVTITGYFDSSLDGSTIGQYDLQTALASGNVTISTSAGPGDGNIYVQVPISWNFSTLTLSAYNSVWVETGIGGNYGRLVMQADNAGTGVGTVAVTGDFLQFTGGTIDIFSHPASYATPTNYAYNAQYSSGVTINSTMLISNAAQLASLSAASGVSYLNGTYALNANIDLSGIANWTPIGSGGAFEGTLHGNGYAISNMTVGAALAGGSGNQGLFFNLVNALIDNLTVNGALIENYSTAAVNGYAGVLAGTVGGTTTINNVSVSGTINETVPYAGGAIGAIAIGSSTISGLAANVTITSGGGNVGGLVGLMVAGAISNSSATGNVSGTSNVGGLVGAMSAGSISLSYATGAVSGAAGGTATGGFVGNLSGGAISDSYANGLVSGGVAVGGFAGIASGANLARVFATGGVSGTGTIGGFAGSLSGTAVTDAYWDSWTALAGQAIGAGSSGGVTSLTTTQFLTALPTGFSAGNWALTTGYFPHLLSNVAAVPSGGSALVSGIATDANGNVLANATVELASGGMIIASAVTAGNGAFSLPVLIGAVAAGNPVLTIFGGTISGDLLTTLPTGGTITGQTLQQGAISLASGIGAMSQANALFSAAQGSLSGSAFISAAAPPGGILAYDIAAGSFSLDTSLSTPGILQLNSTGMVIEAGSGALSAASLALLGGSGNWTLGNTSTNSIGTLAGQLASLQFSQPGALTLGSVVGTAGTITGLAGAGTLALSSAAAVTVNAALTDTIGAGQHGGITLVAGTDIFVNHAITGTGGTVDVLLSADQAGAGGGVSMATNVTLQTTGAVTIGGGALGDGSGFAVGDAASLANVGVGLDTGASILAGGAVTIRGAGTATPSYSVGIMLGQGTISGASVLLDGEAAAVPGASPQVGFGVLIGDGITVPATVTATSGNVVIIGDESNVTGNAIYGAGVWLSGTAKLSALAGSVLVSGTGGGTGVGGGGGISAQANSVISAAQAISLSGTSANAQALALNLAGTIGGAGSGAFVTLAGDTMLIPGTIVTTGEVAIAPASTGLAMEIMPGASVVAGTLELSGATLGHISAGTLAIGTTLAGSLELADSINLLGTIGTLLLASGAGVGQTAGSLAVAQLGVTGVGLSLTEAANAVGTLAANVTGDVTLNQAADLFVGSVAGISGIAAGGNVDLVSGGSLVLNAPVTDLVGAASAGGITLVAGSDIFVNAAITGTGGPVDVLLSADQADNGGGVALAAGITTSGAVTIGGGTLGDGSSYAVGDAASYRDIGVAIEPGVSILAGGAVTIRGAGTLATSAYGILLSDGAISGTSVTLDGVASGVAGAPGAYGFGVLIGDGLNNPATVTATAGNIVITGDDSAITSNSVYSAGIWLTGAALLSAPSGAIEMTGTGGGSGAGGGPGITANTGARIEAATIALTGLANAGVTDALDLGAALGGAESTANIVLAADSMNLVGAIQTTGQVTLAPVSAGTVINIAPGAVASAGTLAFSGAELDAIQAGTLVIGAANAGSLVVNDTLAMSGVVGALMLESGAGVTQSGGAIRVDGLGVVAASATLANAANQIGTLAANVASGLTVSQSAGLVVGNVGGLAGIVAAGDVSLGTDGTMTLDGIIQAGGAGDALVLSAAAIVNNAGNAALVTPGGNARYLAFLPTASAALASGLDALLWLDTSESAWSGGAGSGAGNRLVVAQAATLTVAANGAVTTYGTAPTIGTTVSGVLSGDTAANAYGGTPSLGTLPINAGTYGVTPGAGSFASGENYNIAFTAGTLVINPAPLMITTDGAVATYGTAPTLNASYTGLEYTDTASSLAGTLGFTGQGINTGTYSVTPGGVSSGNYAISYGAGTLVVNRAPLTITTNGAVTTYGTVATLNASYTGLEYTDTASSLSGALGFAGQGINAGTYSVTPGGISSGNYAISFAAGRLVVNPAPLTITTNGAVTTYGTAPTLNASYTGWEYTDTAS